MEHHIRCDAKDIGPCVFCPGDQARARKIADHFENSRVVTESRGYVVLSGRTPSSGSAPAGSFRKVRKPET